MVIEIIGLILIICILVGVSFKDAKCHIIPNYLVILLGITGVSVRFSLGKIDFVQIILDSMAVALFMLIVSLIFKGAFGGGDIKIMMASGILLGYRTNVEVFVIAMILTAIAGGIQMIREKKRLRECIPLGPMISIGIIWGYVNVYLSI